MKDRNKAEGQPLGCPECREGLQDYLDGTLEKQRSLLFFLHLRECRECRREQEQLQHLYDLLQSLPDHPVPEGFDEPILAAVPYEAYRAMEPLRRERVPVFLEEEFLPAWVRSALTRWTGVAVAAAGLAAVRLLGAPDWAAPVGMLGLVPWALVLLQGLGRRATLAQRRTES